jgi:excisionase family DNA binding protein
MKTHAPALPHWPRILRREMAAAYLGVSASYLEKLVKAGTVPGPLPLGDNVRGWDRQDLDAAIDRLKGHAPGNPWDQVA